MMRFLAPLGLFIVLVAFLAIGLTRNPREVPSPFIGKPAPQFQVPQLTAGPDAQDFSPADMRGQVWLFNVWASWCVSCRQEHPLLVELARSGEVPIIGLNYKDQTGDALQWLSQHGDPYLLSAVDANGDIGINYGVYGVPETYVIDKEGVIRFKQIGPITVEALQEKILPLVAQLRQ